MNINQIYTDISDLQIPENISPRSLFQNWYSRFYINIDPDKHGIIGILSTIQPDNKPYSRAVFIYDIDYTFNKTGKFSFITSTITSKCEDIKYNPHVSLLFLWNEHQIVISGIANICDKDINDNVWNSRTDRQHKNSWNNYISRNEIVSDIINISDSPEFRLPRVPNWSVIEIIPKTFDFSYEGPLLSRIRAHYYLNENDIWIRKNNRINKIRCREGSENTVIEENIFT